MGDSSKDWLVTSYVDEDDLEFLSFLSLVPKCMGVPPCSVYGGWRVWIKPRSSYTVDEHSTESHPSPQLFIILMRLSGKAIQLLFL